MLNELDDFDPHVDDDGLDATLQRVESELVSRGAHVAPCGRSSVHHRGVEMLMLLQGWQQSPMVQVAGILFAAYRSTGERPAVFSLEERELVREIVGEQAEQLVYASSSAESLPERGPDLAVLEVADAACTSGFDGAPAPWLHRASLFGASLRATASAPPVFENCTATVAPDAEAALLNAYSRAWRGGLADAGAVDALAGAAEAAPWVAEPFVVLGLHALAAQDTDRAAACSERAIALLRAWNNAWDKRLGAVEWLGIAQMLERSSRLASREHSFLAARIASALQIAAGRPEVLQARLNSLDLIGTATVEPPLPRVAASVEEEEWEGWSGFDLLPPRFAKYIAGLRDNHDSPAMPWYPDLDARTIWDVLELDIVRDLHARAADIAAECAAIDPARFESAAGIADLGPDWRIVPLVRLGSHCPSLSGLPAVADVLRRYSELRRVGSFAFVGRLAPHSDTVPRRGPSNLQVQCMFGVDVAGASGVTVDGIRERFRQRGCIVVSESAIRSDWNDSDREQVVLIVQLWHPDVTADEVTLLEGLARHARARGESVSKRAAKPAAAMLA